MEIEHAWQNPTYFTFDIIFYEHYTHTAHLIRHHYWQWFFFKYLSLDRWGHPKMQTMQTADHADHADCADRADWVLFFLTLDWLSHFFRFYSYKIVSWCLLFILSTSNCWFNRQTRLKHFVWEIPFTDPKYTKIKHKIKLPHILGANCVNFLLVFAFAFGLVLVTLISVHLYIGVFVMHGRASSVCDCWRVIGSAIPLVQNILK